MKYSTFNTKVTQRIKNYNLREFGNIRKMQKLDGKECSAQPLFNKFKFCNSDQKLRQGRYQSFLTLSNFV